MHTIRHYFRIPISMRKSTPSTVLPDFWVTNTSNRNVSLSDLALTIPAYRTVNLMDTRHYSYTIEQLKKSEESGSIFRKRSMISVRKTELKMPSGKYIDHSIVEGKIKVSKDVIPSRQRSTVVIKEEKYDELQVSDEDFASENADLEGSDEPASINKGQ